MSSECLRYDSSYRLFPRPTFLTGVGRLLDWTGALNRRNASRSPAEADCRALASDWAFVGQHLIDAMVRVWDDLDDKQRLEVYRAIVSSTLRQRGYDEVSAAAVLRELEGRSRHPESVA